MMEIKSAVQMVCEVVKSFYPPRTNGKTIIAESLNTIIKYVNEKEESAERYRWHDLRKNPDDLPELYIRKELWFGGDLYSVGCLCGDCWSADLYRGLSEKEYRIPVIAWRDIEPFEEVE